MAKEITSCSLEEDQRGIVSAIVNDGGGQQIHCGDLNTVLSFFPGQSSLDQAVLDRIRRGIRLRCWCNSFGAVRADDTIGDLKARVSHQHDCQGEPIKQDGSPDKCCT